jgi:predicted nucleotidyltransferase
MKPLQLEPRHLKVVLEILGANRSAARAFGSRARGDAKRLSDLDIVFVEAIERSALARLRELFEESSLPFKVDLVEWRDIDPAFQALIANDMRPF